MLLVVSPNLNSTLCQAISVLCTHLLNKVLSPWECCLYTTIHVYYVSALVFGHFYFTVIFILQFNTPLSLLWSLSCYFCVN